MSMFRNRLMKSVQQDVIPSEYRKVNFLTSDGIQYIESDSFYKDRADLTIECKFLYENDVENAFIASTPTFVQYGIKSDGHRRVGASVPGCNPVFGATIGNIYTIKVRYLYGETDETKVYEVYLNDILRQSGVLSTTGKNSLLTRIFGSHQSTIYRVTFKNYSESIVYSDLLPCVRKIDNKPGMYDIVSGSFFVNQGTGKDFVWG